MNCRSWSPQSEGEQAGKEPVSLSLSPLQPPLHPAVTCLPLHRGVRKSSRFHLRLSARCNAGPPPLNLSPGCVWAPQVQAGIRGLPTPCSTDG